MRTLHIGDEWHTDRAGGLNSYYYELICHLGPTDTLVHGLVLGSNDISRSTQGQVVAFAKYDENLAKRMFSVRRSALDYLGRNKVDLIASHFALYTMPVIDRLKSVPTVVHFHGPWAAESSAEGASNYRSWLKAKMEQSVYSRARRLIVLSEAFKRELIARYGIPENLIRVVPAGVDVERFNTLVSRSEARRRLGWPNDRPIILSIRRQVRRMGLEDLIDAAKLLVQECPDVLILLGGAGPLSDQLQERIVELNLEQNVRRLGRIKDMDLPLAYRAADMTVVPSQSLEGFGLITLESLASGTPVYVTPVGGMPEIIKPFAPQCIFASTSAADIAQGLAEALQAKRPLPSDAACRAYSSDNFSWPKIAQRVRAVYDEAVA